MPGLRPCCRRHRSDFLLLASRQRPCRTQTGHAALDSLITALDAAPDSVRNCFPETVYILQFVPGSSRNFFHAALRCTWAPFRVSGFVLRFSHFGIRMAALGRTRGKVGFRAPVDPGPLRSSAFAVRHSLSPRVGQHEIRKQTCSLPLDIGPFPRSSPRSLRLCGGPSRAFHLGVLGVLAFLAVRIRCLRRRGRSRYNGPGH